MDGNVLVVETTSFSCPSFCTPISNTLSVSGNKISKPSFVCSNSKRKCYNNWIANHRRLAAPISAMNDVSTVADPARVEVSWQIIVGAIAGVTPFVVAGIGFSKRIVAQRRCEVCGGSGLVLREKGYFKCPGCGGFLPWQSWKRFFTG